MDATLRVIAGAIGTIACAPGFRGCPFINAAAEYPDPDSPIRKAVDAHRRWNVLVISSRREAARQPRTVGFVALSIALTLLIFTL